LSKKTAENKQKTLILQSQKTFPKFKCAHHPRAIDATFVTRSLTFLTLFSLEISFGEKNTVTHPDTHIDTETSTNLISPSVNLTEETNCKTRLEFVFFADFDFILVLALVLHLWS